MRWWRRRRSRADHPTCDRCETCGTTLTAKTRVEIVEIIEVDDLGGTSLAATYCRRHAPKD